MNGELRVSLRNRCLATIRQLWREEKGVNLVIVALLLMVLLGFSGIAIDGGNVYYQHQRLQIAADAAALGGTRLLALGASHDAVGAEIDTIAQKNSADSAQWTLINGDKGVTVVAMREVSTYFAKLYGYDVFAVRAEAEAEYEPVQKTDNLFPMTVGCDCVEDGMLTLVADEPGSVDDTIETTDPMTMTIGLDDNMDSSYMISYLGRTGKIWSYMVTELEGRDLKSWGLGIGSCLDKVVTSDPGDAEIGADRFNGIKWKVGNDFSSGIFTFELNGTYPFSVVQATAKTNNNKSTTADIIGPDCSGVTIPEESASEAVVSMCLPTIDFETDDAGISLASGHVIDEQWEGWGVHVTTDNPGSHPAMIFDSGNPTGGDWDLGAANEDFGGPGLGNGGRAGTPGENSRAMGKLLIISEDNDASDPDDKADGGTLSFTFDVPVRVDEIHMVDVDDASAIGEFKAYSTQDRSNLVATAKSLALGDNSFQVVPLNASGVSRLDITLPKGGGIQSIVSCRSDAMSLRRIGDLIWADANDNGIQDGDESGIPGVEMELYLSGESQVVATTVTDLNGQYEFRNLPPGGAAVYEVKVADVNFEAGRVLENLPYSKRDEGGDNALDSDFDSATGRALVPVSEDGASTHNIDGGFVLDNSEGLPTIVLLNMPGNDGQVLTGQQCAADVGGFDLNCTAEDVSIFEATNIFVWDDGCVSQDDTVSFTADFEVQLTAQARHDIGIWFAEDGDPNGDGAHTGTCTVATPAYAPDTLWVDLDGKDKGVQDTCGDIDETHNPIFPTITMTVKCNDPDGDGLLNLPYVTSWRVPGADELCTSPLGAYPATPSKCKSDTGFQVDINVPPPTTSTTTSEGECTTFRWLDWDGGTTSSMELKLNMESTNRSGAWQIDELIPSGPAMSTSAFLQSGLSSKMGKKVVIPLSDDTENGNDVCGFGEVELVSYTTANDKHFLTLQFVKDVIRSLGTDATLPDYGARDVVVKK